MTTLTRRGFVTALGGAVGTAMLAPATGRLSASVAAAPTGEKAANYIFFDAAEARFIEAACARLIPPDESGPGALEVGACNYLDAQLAGYWGAGKLECRSGPWQPGISLPAAATSTPAEFFRAALRAINHALHDRGAPFATMSQAAQDTFLRSLSSGEANVGVAPEFFDLLLQMTVEGFFNDPLLVSARDRIAWPMTSFPGAHASRS